MENKGFATALGIFVVLGLFGVWFYQDDAAREDPASAPERLFREVTGVERRANYERQRDTPEALDTVEGYGVSAGHPLAVDVGMEVLEQGGNAVDAAVAVAYALGVVQPYGSGIGGGGGAIVYVPGEEPAAYDYREVVAQNGEIPFLKTGIPGFVQGMEELHADHGTGDISRLLEPAITLAEEGLEVSRMLQGRLEGAAFRMPVDNLPLFFPNGRAIEAGQSLVQQDLADTMRVIAENGAEEFYTGALGEALADAVDGIDTESLAAYEVQRLDPVQGEAFGYDIVSGPPPLPGVALIQTLQIAEALGVAEYELDSPDYVHSIAMAWLFANHFRIDEVGDVDFVDVPVDWLTDAEANLDRSRQISMDQVLDIDEDEPYGGLETDTTHITVVDADGAMVSMTNTLSNFFGTGENVFGFFLNDQLKNFAHDDPDSPNYPEPGKRPRSFITPTIVAQDGRPVIGLGSPGGRRIPIVLAQVITRWAAHGQDLADAVAAPRFHREELDLEFEEPPPSDLVEDLRARGYDSIAQAWNPLYYGGIQALAIDYDANRLYGVADDRRGGDWRVGAP